VQATLKRVVLAAAQSALTMGADLYNIKWGLLFRYSEQKKAVKRYCHERQQEVMGYSGLFTLRLSSDFISDEPEF